MSDLSPGATPPGWYRDPSGVPEMRWWDGHVWTAYSAPLHTFAPQKRSGWGPGVLAFVLAPVILGVIVVLILVVAVVMAP